MPGVKKWQSEWAQQVRAGRAVPGHQHPVGEAVDQDVHHLEGFLAVVAALAAVVAAVRGSTLISTIINRYVYPLYAYHACVVSM